MKFFRKRRKLATEQKTAEELRASIEEKLANYTPDNHGKATFNTLPLPTSPTAEVIRDIRSRIVVADPEGDRLHLDPEHIRSRATDQSGDTEDLSDLIDVPESTFELDWIAHGDEVTDDHVDDVRGKTERYWNRENAQRWEELMGKDPQD